jgi:hypothetical protein
MLLRDSRRGTNGMIKKQEKANSESSAQIDDGDNMLLDYLDRLKQGKKEK